MLRARVSAEGWVTWRVLTCYRDEDIESKGQLPGLNHMESTHILGRQRC